MDLRPLPSLLAQLLLERPNAWPWALALLLLALAILLGFLYPSHPAHLTHTSARWASSLRLLRGAVVLLLALMTLGLSWRRPLTPAETGGVTVLLDNSLSMAVIDSGRDPAKKLRVAEAVGLWTGAAAGESLRLREAHSDSALDTLESTLTSLTAARQEVEATELTRRDPRSAREKRDKLTADLSRLLASAQSDPALPDEVKAPLASAPATDLLTAEQPLRDRLTDSRRALRRWVQDQYRQFTDSSPDARQALIDVSKLNRIEIGKRVVANLLPQGVPVRWYSLSPDPATPVEQLSSLDAVRPDIPRTNLSAAIRALSDPAATSSGAALPGGPRAILVLSDGRLTDRTNDPAATLGLDVPVISVALGGVGAEDGEVSIREARVPTLLRLNQPAKALLAVRLNNTGNSDGRVLVKLDAAGLSQIRELRLATGEQRQVDFDLTTDRTGQRILDFSASIATPSPTTSPATTRPPDASTSLSPADTVPRQHVRRTLSVVAERPSILILGRTFNWDAQKLYLALRQQPWLTVQTASPIPPAPNQPDPLPDLIASADAVVLADTSATDLSPSIRAALTDLLHRRAGTLLLLPGPSLPSTWTDDELRSWLPLSPTPPNSDSPRWLSSMSTTGQYATTPTPEGHSLGLTPDLFQSDLSRVLSPGPLKPHARTLLKDPATGEPRLIQATASNTPNAAGTVLLLATDQAWRWSDSFFSTLPNLLVEKPYPAVDGAWAIDASASNGVIKVRTRHQGVGKIPVIDAVPPTLLLRHAGQLIAEIPTRFTRPGRSEGTATSIPDGDYTLSLRDTEQPRLTLLVGDSGEKELTDVEGERANLERFARETGGLVGDVWDLAAVRQRLADTVKPNGRSTIDRWWNSPILMTLLAALLCIEWSLRKHWGLP